MKSTNELLPNGGMASTDAASAPFMVGDTVEVIIGPSNPESGSNDHNKRYVRYIGRLTVVPDILSSSPARSEHQPPINVTTQAYTLQPTCAEKVVSGPEAEIRKPLMQGGNGSLPPVVFTLGDIESPVADSHRSTTTHVTTNPSQVHMRHLRSTLQE